MESAGLPDELELDVEDFEVELVVTVDNRELEELDEDVDDRELELVVESTEELVPLEDTVDEVSRRTVDDEDEDAAIGRTAPVLL